jgi:ABC-2 type transport system permease protein
VKLFTIIAREYRKAACTRAFVVMTLLAPLLLAVAAFLPSLFRDASARVVRVAVVDEIGGLEAVAREELERPASADAVAPWIARTDVRVEPRADSADALLVLARAESRLTERTHLDDEVVARIRASASRVVARARYRDATGADDLFAAAAIRVDRAAATSPAPLPLPLAFAAATLLFVPVLLYGQSLMSGIVQEKSGRILELLLSSVSPTTLLAGKMLGLALAGLTQIAAWSALAALSRAFSAHASSVASLVRVDTAAAFVVCFALGYAAYVCLYAGVGALAQTQEEAQQRAMPVTAIMTVQWLTIAPVANDPHGTLARVLSMTPVLGPVTLFLRVCAGGVGALDLASSLAVSVGTAFLLLRGSTALFRAGALRGGAPAKSRVRFFRRLRGAE